jgi:hypothetical protein
MSDGAKNRKLIESILVNQTYTDTTTQVSFEVSNDICEGESSSSVIRPLYETLSTSRRRSAIWSYVEERIYNQMLADIRRLSVGGREIYTYFGVPEPTSEFPTLTRGEIKVLEDTTQVNSPSSLPFVHIVKSQKLGTLFEVRYKSRCDTIMKNNVYITTFDRHIIRCWDGFKLPIALDPIIHKIHQFQLHQTTTGFNRYPKLMLSENNKMLYEDNMKHRLRSNHDHGIYISTFGNEIAVIVYNSMTSQMFFHLYHTRQLLEYDSSNDTKDSTPFEKRSFSYWPLIDQHSEITWIHGHWIVIFPLLDIICCYNPMGIHLSTLPLAEITICAVHEGLTMEDCKIAFWKHDDRDSTYNNILIWKLSELLTIMPALQTPFDIDTRVDINTYCVKKITKFHSLQRQWESKLQEFQEKRNNHMTLTSFSINNIKPSSDSYRYCQWLDTNNLVVQSIHHDGNEALTKSRLFYNRMFTISHISTDVSTILSSGFDPNLTLAPLSKEIKENHVNKITRHVNTSVVTEVMVGLKTNNCYIDREIILTLPRTNITVHLYTPPSRNHIRFEFECLLTFLQTRTNLFQTLLPVDALTTLMLQYLY